MSLKPIPPNCFGTHNLSQLNQWILPLSSDDLHQKAAIADVRFLQVDFGNLKQLIAYIGMAKATDFRIISLPA